MAKVDIPEYKKLNRSIFLEDIEMGMGWAFDENLEVR